MVDDELDAEGGLGAVDPGQARIKELKLKNVFRLLKKMSVMLYANRLIM